ncbi:MAG TPA: hypothetical protein VJU85_09745 [Nitrososphaeraceae archaeon]|nr:hypothetical protein [Nitrososphaeraceae archaeon]
MFISVIGKKWVLVLELPTGYNTHYDGFWRYDGALLQEKVG